MGEGNHDSSGNKFGEKKKILKSKPTKKSIGKEVPTTVFGGIADSFTNKKLKQKTHGKDIKTGTFKEVKMKGTKTPFGLKPLPCKPAYMFATAKYLVDNTHSHSDKYKPQGFAAEKFLSFPRNDFVI